MGRRSVSIAAATVSSTIARRISRIRASGRSQDKVEVVIDPQAEEERLRLNNRGAVVVLETTDGRRLEKRVQYSRGPSEEPADRR